MGYFGRYFNTTLTWSWPKWKFMVRPNFYCYLLPQRELHLSVLKPGVFVNTYTTYYWLNFILRVDHTRSMYEG